MPRLLSIAAAGMIFAITLSAAAIAAPNLPTKQDEFAQPPEVVIVHARCGQGWHWIPAGYARHGKWRAGHCALG